MAVASYLFLFFLCGNSAITDAFGVNPQTRLRIAEGRAPPIHKFWFSEGQSFGEVIRTNSTKRSASSDARCGAVERATVTSGLKNRCPDDCPFRAEEMKLQDFCSFRCVADWKQCRAINVRATVADVETGSCISCQLGGCHRCSSDGTKTCDVCASGYFLRKGRCISVVLFVWAMILTLIIAGLIILILWCVELEFRKITNKSALEHGRRHRARARLNFMTDDAGSGQRQTKAWPLFTDLRNVNVAGAGLMGHFRFQGYAIVWAAVVVIGWTAMAFYFDKDLLTYGQSSSSNPTPWESCITTAQGYAVQQRLMMPKVIFMICLYVVTFLSLIVFSVQQRRRYEKMDLNETSMKDFALLCVGLPIQRGEELVEEELQEMFAEETGESVVGVSVCWNGHNQWETFEQALIEETDQLWQQSPSVRASGLSAASAALTGRRSVFTPHQTLFSREQFQTPSLDPRTSYRYKMEKGVLLMAGVKEEEEEVDEDEMCDILRNLESSGSAFVVFETEEGRDRALIAVQEKGGMCHRDHQLQLRELSAEPDTVQWESFSYAQNFRARWGRVVESICVMIVITGCHTIFCYVPYMAYYMGYTRDNGMEPDFFRGFMVSLIVVVGNQIGYFSCRRVAQSCRFRFSDDSEAAYVLLYFCFIMVTSTLDIWIAYRCQVTVIRKSNAIRTHDGIPLGEIAGFFESFETFAMQQILGHVLWVSIALPTFMTMSLPEVVSQLAGPYWIFSRLVRTHSEVSAKAAEKALVCVDMDLGRYADILCSVAVACMVFFFPGGLVVKMFLSLLVSLWLTYLWDHYRVLRNVRRCFYATLRVDRWAQKLWSIPLGILLSATVFKANCQPGFSCFGGYALFGVCFISFVVHIVCHCLILSYFVPVFGIRKGAQSCVTFQHAAAQTACTWFSANPVYCLRSKHVYEHDPPCSHFVRGKEHLIERNPEAKSYFDGVAGHVEKSHDILARAHLALSRVWTDRREATGPLSCFDCCSERKEN